MLFHKIEPAPNSVRIEKTILARPSHISPSEWENFWSQVRRLNDEFMLDPAINIWNGW